MLVIDVSKTEMFDESDQTFRTEPAVRLHLEHSLVSLSKWESFFEKPFLGRESRTQDETIHYIKCMILDEDVDPDVVLRLSSQQLTKITEYISAKMSGTTLPETSASAPTSRETISSELFYYWMTALGIPFECENWHLNRLITLIRVANLKSSPPKKQSAKSLAEERRALNAQRRQKFNTAG